MLMRAGILFGEVVMVAVVGILHFFECYLSEAEVGWTV